MKPIILNKYSTAAILLFAAAAVFIDIALISNPGEITTAAFVISGMVFSFHWYERIKGIVTMLIIQNPPRPPFSKGGLGGD